MAARVDSLSKGHDSSCFWLQTTRLCCMSRKERIRVVVAGELERFPPSHRRFCKWKDSESLYRAKRSEINREPTYGHDLLEEYNISQLVVKFSPRSGIGRRLWQKVRSIVCNKTIINCPVTYSQLSTLLQSWFVHSFSLYSEMWSVSRDEPHRMSALIEITVHRIRRVDNFCFAIDLVTAGAAGHE